jgi:hypothetical protein
VTWSVNLELNGLIFLISLLILGLILVVNVNPIALVATVSKDNFLVHFIANAIQACAIINQAFMYVLVFVKILQ